MGEEQNRVVQAHTLVIYAWVAGGATANFIDASGKTI
jgi:hypothetical protein